MSVDNCQNQILCVSGRKGSGKDTLCDYLVAKHGFTKFAYADALKRMSVPLIHAIFPSLKDEITLESMYDGDAKEKVYPSLSFAGKPFSIRWFLQFVGTDVMRAHLSEDLWVEHVMGSIRALLQNPTTSQIRVCISDCRFENEVAKCRALASTTSGVRVKSVRVHRPGLPSESKSFVHSSEANEFEVDCPLMNDGSLEDLYAKVEKLIKE